MQEPNKMLDLLLKLHRIFKIRKLKKEPIFIGGCGRSGTTLLLSIMGAHPKIQAIAHECYFFNNKPSLMNNCLRRVRIIYNLIEIDIKKGAHRWCEKTPLNVLKIDEIHKFFRGKYKFIHIVRDGRDVVTSRHPNKPTKYWVSIDRWINDVEEGLTHLKNENMYLLKYEDLILNFEYTMSNLLEFIGERNEKEVFEFHVHTNVKNDRAWAKGVEKIRLDSVKKWQQPEHSERIKEFYNNKKAVTLLKKLGYE